MRTQKSVVIRFRSYLVVALIIMISLACNLPNLGEALLKPSQTPLSNSTAEPTAPRAGKETTTPPGSALDPISPTMTAGDLIVAYTNSEKLYLWSHGGPKLLTQQGDVHSPQISPDGKVIAFLRTADDFHLEIWAVNVDGTNERRLVSVADMDAIGGGVRDSAAVAVNPYRIRWTPGTNQVAFNSNQVFQGPGLNLLNDLNLVDASTGKIQNLFLSGWGGEFNYSSDGTKVIISQPDKLILANADGSDYRLVLTYDPVTTYSEYRYYALPVWSPDGSYLLTALPPVDPLAQPVQPTELWRIDVESSQARLLGSVQTVPFFEQPVAFSPDLERIAYLKEVGQPYENRRELYLAASDGTGEWLYAQAAPLFFLRWSPNSAQFAYALGEDREAWLGSLSDSPKALGPGFAGLQGVIWVSPDRWVGWQQVENRFELRLVDLTDGSLLLDSIFGAPPAISIF